MKKLFLVGLLSIFCLNLFGCGSNINEDSVVLPPTDDELLDLAAQALPCDEGTTFANFALLGTGVSKEGNLMYYGVDEVVGYMPTEDGKSLKDTCYRIAPVAMEVSQSDKGFTLVNVETVEDYAKDFLLEDYSPEFDGGKLDEAVKAIFSDKAFAVWQQRDYWEHFTDYDDVDRKSFEDRAMEYFNIEPPHIEDFVSYYDDLSIKETGTYVNEVKEGTWTTYDEEGNVIETQDYVNGNPVEEFGSANYTILGPDDGFEKERNEGTLVLRASYEDHTDYIFLTEGMWEGFLSEVNAGDTVTFQGKVYFVDGAAGSHYYNAEYVEQLEVVNTEEI